MSLTNKHKILLLSCMAIGVGFNESSTKSDNIKDINKIFIELFALSWSLTHFFVFDKLFDAIILEGSGYVISKITSPIREGLKHSFKTTKENFKNNILSTSLNNISHNISYSADKIIDRTILSPLYQVGDFLSNHIFGKEEKKSNKLYNMGIYIKDIIIPIEPREFIKGVGIAYIWSLTHNTPIIGGLSKKIYEFAEQIPCALLGKANNLLESYAHSVLAKPIVFLLDHNNIQESLPSSYIANRYAKFFEKEHGVIEFFHHLVLFFNPIITGNVHSHNCAHAGHAHNSHWRTFVKDSQHTHKNHEHAL